MDEFLHPPITRHKALIPLSRDHYTGLVHAQRLIRAASEDRVARHSALAEFLDAWESEIGGHLDDEERLLLELLGEEDRRRLIEEHREMREHARRAREQRQRVDPDATVLRELGECLREHIRWEERELFSRVQSSVDPAVLERLERETAAIEAKRPRDVRRGADAE